MKLALRIQGVLKKAQMSLFPGMALIPAPKNPSVKRWQQTTPEPVKGAALEPWQMTLSEFAVKLPAPRKISDSLWRVDYAGESRPFDSLEDAQANAAQKFHRADVRDARDAGKPISDAVKADYPDLFPVSGKKRKGGRKGKLLSADAISDFRPGIDKVVRRGDKTFIVDTQGEYADEEVRSDMFTEEYKSNLENLTQEQLAGMEMAVRNTATLSDEGQRERIDHIYKIRKDRGWSYVFKVDEDPKVEGLRRESRKASDDGDHARSWAIQAEIDKAKWDTFTPNSLGYEVKPLEGLDDRYFVSQVEPDKYEIVEAQNGHTPAIVKRGAVGYELHLEGTVKKVGGGFQQFFPTQAVYSTPQDAVLAFNDAIKAWEAPQSVSLADYMKQNGEASTHRNVVRTAASNRLIDWASDIGKQHAADYPDLYMAARYAEAATSHLSELMLSRMRQVREESERLYEAGRKSQAPYGSIAVGSEGAFEPAVADALSTMLREVGAGKTVEAARKIAGDQLRAMIQAVNKKRPKDINWQRWENHGQDKLDWAERRLQEGENGPMEKSLRLVLRVGAEALSKAQLALFPGMVLAPAKKNPMVKRWQQTKQEAPKPREMADGGGIDLSDEGLKTWTEDMVEQGVFSQEDVDAEKERDARWGGKTEEPKPAAAPAPAPRAFFSRQDERELKQLEKEYSRLQQGSGFAYDLAINDGGAAVKKMRADLKVVTDKMTALRVKRGGGSQVSESATPAQRKKGDTVKLKGEDGKHVIVEWNGDRGFVAPADWDAEKHGKITPRELIHAEDIEDEATYKSLRLVLPVSAEALAKAQTMQGRPGLTLIASKKNAQVKRWQQTMQEPEGQPRQKKTEVKATAPKAKAAVAPVATPKVATAPSKGADAPAKPPTPHLKVSEGHGAGYANEPSDTLSIYRKADGTWEPERAKLHEKIIGQFLDHVKVAPPKVRTGIFNAGERVKQSWVSHWKELVPKDKIAVFLMGSPAAGKTTLARGKEGVYGSGLPDNFVVVDPDEVKYRMPEYVKGGNQGKDYWKGQKDEMKGPEHVHEESSYLSKEIMSRAMRKGCHFIKDGCNADAKKMTAMIEQAHKAGYTVVLNYIRTTEALAQERNASRGRVVPKGMVHKIYQAASHAFGRVGQYADYLQVYESLPQGGFNLTRAEKHLAKALGWLGGMIRARVLQKGGELVIERE